MQNYITSVLDPANTPQTEALPGQNQVKNSAGGFVFAVDNWTRLQRWLVLGSESSTYYSSGHELTKENIEGLKAALADDGIRFVNTVADISRAGRAPKNEPALFALALAAADKRPDVSAHALAKLTDVARIPTHLFSFVEYLSGLRGWSRSRRTAIANWYLDRPVDKLAYALQKYHSRNGWSNRDLMRLSHPRPRNDDHKALLQWAVKGWESVGDEPHSNPVLAPIWAFERAKRLNVLTDVRQMVNLITEYNLPRECVPTEFLNEVSVWEALLEKMPVTAMIRNLGKMTSIGLVAPNSAAAKTVGDRLTDANLLRKARIHPISVLMASSIYKQGRGLKGSLSWSPVVQINNALEKAFYDSFANAPVTGKRFYFGLDISGSMGMGTITGTNLCPRDASAALALVTMRTEPQYYAAGFTSGSRGFGYGSTAITQLPLNPSMSLGEAIASISNLPFGSTDCSLPMLDAAEKNIPVDVFIVLTDSETYQGSIHATVALQKYRNKMGIDAKLIVMGLVSNGFTLADPSDAGQMDIVGFDASVPQIIADFVGGAESVAPNTEE